MPFSGNTESDRTEYGFRLRYETLRSLLERNVVALQILSNLEADLNHYRQRDFRIQNAVRRLVDEATLMAQELNLLSSDKYDDLYAVLEKIREELSASFARAHDRPGRAVIVSLGEEESGGKASGLASVARVLPGSVPAGFTVTTAAYRRFLEENDLEERIVLMFQDIDVVSDHGQFRSRIETINSWILSATIPESVRRAIAENVEKMPEPVSKGWAVRSSAVDEDGRYSFAGQFETILGARTEALESAARRSAGSRRPHGRLVHAPRRRIRGRNRPNVGSQ